jgi:hypothetical protein
MGDVGRKARLAGTVVWNRGREFHSSLDWYYINDGRPGIRLIYSAQGETFMPVLYLTPCACNYGGLRWYWCCPGCGRRCRCLYLQRRDFLCRQCLDLTYWSAQRAHKSSAWMRRWDL